MKCRYCGREMQCHRTGNTRYFCLYECLYCGEYLVETWKHHDDMLRAEARAISARKKED